MKKNTLIKLLQSIEGNPEVKIYNGYVEDFMNVHPPKVKKIHKMSNKKRLYFVNLENESRGKPKVDKLSKTDPWELTKEHFDDESKTVILLEPKVRGLTSYGSDSAGDLTY
jgi:hypothetical protein